MKNNVKAVLKLNRRIVYITTAACIIGVILCGVMLYWVSNDSLSEIEDPLIGQLVFAFLALLIIAATVYCYSRLYITLYFTDKGIRFVRAFRRTYYHSYNYYSYVFFGYSMRQGKTINNDKKTYYVLLTRNIYCDYDLCHMNFINMEHHTIKLFYSEELHSLLLRVLPSELCSALNEAVTKEETKKIYY